MQKGIVGTGSKWVSGQKRRRMRVESRYRGSRVVLQSHSRTVKRGLSGGAHWDQRSRGGARLWLLR